MKNNVKNELEVFVHEVGRRVDDLNKNTALSTPRMKAVLVCLLNDGIREFLSKGLTAVEIRGAFAEYDKNNG